MAILFALVARGSVVLAEYSATQTNASAITRQILEKITGTQDSNVSYSQDRYIFHVKRTDGITVLCMADDTAGRRIPFLFLEDIHGRFVKTYGRACHSALAYAMNDEFSRILSQQMDYYTNDPNADRINRMRGEMSQVRNVMIDNIDKVLERGDRLELLVDRTANMQENTVRFRKQARRFQNNVWWRNVKLAEFVNCVRYVRILSPQEVQQMSLDGDLGNDILLNQACSSSDGGNAFRESFHWII